jgi:hypothetical protein
MESIGGRIGGVRTMNLPVKSCYPGKQEEATEIIGSLYWCLYDLVTHVEGGIVPNHVHIAMAKDALSAARRFEDEAQATPQDVCDD